jgi:two-component system phosphate regulon response regulator OmpR
MAMEREENPKGNILVIDDDRRLRALLQQFLSSQGFSVVAAEGAAEARRRLGEEKFDLLVVDVMMPGETGIEFLRGLRATSQVPVLMLTAMGEVDDRITGLAGGADDYLVKPFEPKELLLRLEGILRRTRSRLAGPSARFGEFVFHRENGTLYRGSRFIALTSTELRLLKVLTDHLNEPLSRDALSKMLNGISGRSIDVQIVRLRRKLEDDPKNPLYLQTSWGSGYVLRDRAE